MEPSRNALRQRLIDEGRWQEAVRYREQLRHEGMDVQECWMQMAAAFPPLDGTPPELGVVGPLVNEPPPPIPRLPGEEKGSFPQFARKEDFGEHVEKVKKARKTDGDRWKELAAAIDPTKSAPELECIRWCFNKYLVDPKDLEAESVPSVGALGMLSWLKSNPSNYSEFMRTLFAKCIPDRRQLEYEARFADDGRKQFDMLDDFMKSLVAEEKEVA